MADIELDTLASEYAQLLISQTQQLEMQDKKLNEITETLSQLVTYAADNPDLKTINKGRKEMKYYIPKGCSFFQRKSDNRWEARIRKNGKRVQIACRKDKGYVYNELMKAYRALKPPKQKKTKELTLFTWLDHWHETYRMPKKGNGLSENTIIMDLSMIRKIKKVS